MISCKQRRRCSCGKRSRHGGDDGGLAESHGGGDDLLTEFGDVVLEGALPKTLMNVAEMYAGCISGAIQKDVYLKAIHDAGFKNVTIQKQKAILLPDDILKEYLSESDIKTYKESGVGIFSITVYGEKEKKDQPCCPPGCCN